MRIRITLFTGWILLMSVFAHSARGQRAPMRFGRVDSDDVKMTHFEADSTVKALILGDYGVVEFRYDDKIGFQSHFTRHLRVKIFHMDAADLADFKLPIYKSGTDRERLTQLRARVYNLDGSRVKRTRFSRGDVFQEEVNENITRVNFSLPDVREGTVFEIVYTVVSPFVFSLPAWAFQGEYPVRFSEVRFLTPEYYTYKPLMQGFLPLNATDRDRRRRKFTAKWEEQEVFGKTTKYSRDIEYDENIVIYRIENVPPLTTEPHMNSPINYISRIEHELLSFFWPYGKGRDFSSSWEKLNQTLLRSESFGRLLNRSGFLKDELDQLSQTHAEPMELVIATFQRVQQHMHWTERAGIYAQSENLRRAWSAGEGNVADINLLLVLLLKELNLDAEPVILSTRSNGMINPAQIMLDKFNYVVASVKLDGKLFLLDATEKNNPWFLLPERCLNGQGRVVSERRSDWVELVPYEENHTFTRTLLKVHPDGSMTAEVKKNKTNYHRLKHQKLLSEFSSTEAFMDDYESSAQGFELTDYQIGNLNDWSKPLESTYQFEVPALDNTPKEVIYLHPLLNDRYDSNPFRLEERQFPVDFIYPFKRSFYVEVEVPEGYGVEELPDSKRFILPDRSATYQVSSVVNMDGNIIVSVLMDIRKPLFLPEEYPVLREFFANVVEEEARAIILKKL